MAAEKYVMRLCCFSTKMPNSYFQSKWSNCMRMSWNKASHFTFDSSNGMFQCIRTPKERALARKPLRRSDRPAQPIDRHNLLDRAVDISKSQHENNDIINCKWISFWIPAKIAETHTNTRIYSLANETFYLAFVLLIFSIISMNSHFHRSSN